MINRLASIFVAVALATSGCHEHNQVADIDQEPSTDTGDVDPTEPRRVLDPDDLEHASWPDDLRTVLAQHTDGGVVIDGLNEAGEIIARIELDEVNQSPGVVKVQATFADLRSWAIMDLENGVVVQSGTDPFGESAHTEITARALALSKKAQEQGPDPADPQPGPWLDCALSVLNAVFACLPVVGGGWLVTCPEAIVDAYCKCWSAKKKNMNKPKPAACQD